MPRTLFHLSILSDVHATAYHLPLRDWAAEALPDVTFFDFDNLSDGLVLKYAIDLLAQSERAVLWVVTMGTEAPVGQLIPFLEKFTSHPCTAVLLTTSEPTLLTKLLSLLPPERSQRATGAMEGQEWVQAQLIT